MSQSTLRSAPVRDGESRQVGFMRLVAVEIRKLVDTRSSLAIFAVLAVIAVALVVGLAVFSTGQGTPVTFTSLAGSIGLFNSLAMPLIGILGMTSDTAHRTTLVYYPLLRGRAGQFWAKVLAAALLAVALQLFVFVLSAVVAAALGGSGAGQYDGAGQELWDGLASCLLSTMFGVALAAAIRRTALGHHHRHSDQPRRKWPHFLAPPGCQRLPQHHYGARCADGRAGSTDGPGSGFVPDPLVPGSPRHRLVDHREARGVTFADFRQAGTSAPPRSPQSRR